MMASHEHLVRKTGLGLLVTLIVGFVLVCGAVNHFAFAKARGEVKPSIKLINPPDKAWVTQQKIFLAGAVLGADVKTLSIKGVTVAGKGDVAVEGGGFGAMITLKKGSNTITVKAGSLKKTVTVFYGGAKSRPKGFKHYTLHKGQKPLNCKECHRFRRGKYDFKRNVPARSDCTTAKCHGDKMARDKHVHGPVGAGVCISCHSPHGSFHEKQLEREGRPLCVICHQSKKEEFNKKDVHPPVEDGCIDCHDPHQSAKRFQLLGNPKKKAVSSLCFTCHDSTIFTNKHQHGPVGAGDCIACHNPHASDNDKLLIAPTKGGELCFQCHSDRRDSFNKKQVHKPVKEDCGNCHDPHSTPYRFQLIKSEKELCKSCHQKVSPKVFKDIASAKVKHPPVAKGECTKCHQPHSSNYKPLLANSMEKLCFTCHVELGEDVADSKYRHGPVKTGDCTACHSKIHGSRYPRLLGRAFPMNFYDSYSEKKYDLCFGCHNKDIAKTKFTTKLTNFRDGKYNLHYFHVNRKKGRTCTACHAPHASSQAKHVREEVPFGGWSYPIQFTKTKNGGTCVVGCHSPKTYDRKKPNLEIGKK